jgi:hypothetical protein
MDLKTSVLFVSGEIIKKILKTKNKKIKYSDLYNFFYEKYKEDTEYNFTPALNFLFLLDKIEYSLSKDEVRLKSEIS